MTSPLRVAVVGAGGIARGMHIPAVLDSARAELIALVDVDAARVAETADAHGISGRYTDIDRMLAEQSPDLVIVATPPVAHADAAVASLRAGASVWCEKPPTLSLAEYDRIASFERDGGPYVSYVFQHRFGSAAETLRSQIAAGELGRPLVGICHTLWFRDAAYFDVPWRGRWDTEGGGPTMGHGIHQMDLMLSLLGEWVDVQATMATLDRDVQTEDVSFATVRFESGALVSVVNSVLSPRETSYLRFDFSDATVEVEHLYGYSNSDWRWTPAPHVTDPERIASWRPLSDIRSSHSAQFEALVDAIEAGRRPRASGSDGRRVMELITGMYRSAVTGVRVLRSELDDSDPFFTAMNAGSVDIPFAGTETPTSVAGSHV